jgi:ribose transport system ATP-binding protein
VSTAHADAVRVERLSKTFPGIRALHDVSITVRRGEIHALLGGNGSGKSTLLKILAGVYRGDRGGHLVVDGRPVAAERVTPAWAHAAGLRFVHQDLGVFPTLSVAENLAIGTGFGPRRAGVIDWRRLRRRGRALLDELAIDADERALVQTLPPAERTMLAIARALADDGARPYVYVLDEPTAGLPAQQARRVYDVLRARRDAGHAVLFVSHRLDEVAATADRVSVLRDGVVAGTREGDALDREDLVELIVGRSLAPEHAPAPLPEGAATVLEVDDLAGGPVRGVGFVLRRGEVLGLAGSLGSGCSELLQMLFGARRVRRGNVTLDGVRVRFADVGEAMRSGLAYVPPDRVDAAFLELSLRDNLAAASVPSYWDRLHLQRRREARDARRMMAELAVRASSPEQAMATLSGGNQQKVVLARWLRRAPKVLLLDEPTRGADVAARALLHSLVADAARAGTAVLVASDDFDELSVIADRVLVLERGRVAAELRQPAVDAARLARAAFAGAPAG